MTAGEKIAELLAWSGMSQKQLAKKIDIPRTTLSAYILGRTPLPLHVAEKIADALGVTLWTIINGEPLPADPLELTKAEAELVGRFRCLTLQQQDVVTTLIDVMYRQSRPKK